MVLLSVPATNLERALMENAVIMDSTAVPTAAGAKVVGQSIGAVFGELNKKLGEASSFGGVDVRVSETSEPSEEGLLEAERIRSARVDIEKIKEGISASELLEKLGKPLMSVASCGGGTVYHLGPYLSRWIPHGHHGPH